MGETQYSCIDESHRVILKNLYSDLITFNDKGSGAITESLHIASSEIGNPNYSRLYWEKIPDLLQAGWVQRREIVASKGTIVLSFTKFGETLVQKLVH